MKVTMLAFDEDAARAFKPDSGSAERKKLDMRRLALADVEAAVLREQLPSVRSLDYHSVVRCEEYLKRN